MQSTVSLNSTGSRTKDDSTTTDVASKQERGGGGGGGKGKRPPLLLNNTINVEKQHNNNNNKNKHVEGKSIGQDNNNDNNKYTSKDSAVPKTLVVETNHYQRRFQFDAILGPDASQHDVYCSAVGDIIQQIFKGYNTTIIAYGQTGSG
jgi:hypothetical protein